MTPGSRVRIAAHHSMLPQTIAPFSGRVGVLIGFEDEIAVVRIGGCVLMIAAGHLEMAE